MTRMVVVRALEYSIGADLSQPKAGQDPNRDTFRRSI
jgi:hypothetical protein